METAAPARGQADDVEGGGARILELGRGRPLPDVASVLVEGREPQMWVDFGSDGACDEDQIAVMLR